MEYNSCQNQSIKSKLVEQNVYLLANPIVELVYSADNEDTYELQETFYQCDENDDPIEVFEYWLVSEWFARKLVEQDELVLFDFLGMYNLWGRQTTGQAILLDHSIGKIAESINILEGQENEWKV